MNSKHVSCSDYECAADFHVMFYFGILHQMILLFPLVLEFYLQFVLSFSRPHRECERNRILLLLFVHSFPVPGSKCKARRLLGENYTYISSLDFHVQISRVRRADQSVTTKHFIYSFSPPDIECKAFNFNHEKDAPRSFISRS